VWRTSTFRDGGMFTSMIPGTAGWGGGDGVRHWREVRAGAGAQLIKKQLRGGAQQCGGYGLLRYFNRADGLALRSLRRADWLQHLGRCGSFGGGLGACPEAVGLARARCGPCRGALH